MFYRNIFTRSKDIFIFISILHPKKKRAVFDPPDRNCSVSSYVCNGQFENEDNEKSLVS